MCLTAGFQPLFLEAMFRFHHRLRKLDLHEEEYVLLQAMSLFSAGSGASVFSHTDLSIHYCTLSIFKPHKLHRIIFKNVYIYFIQTTRSSRSAATWCDRQNSRRLGAHTKNEDRLQEDRPQKTVSEALLSIHSV